MGDFAITALFVVPLLVASVVFFALAVKMKQKKLKPNSLIGIRTPKSDQSEEDWYKAQLHCAPFVFLLAFIFLDSAVLFAIHGLFLQSVSFLVPTAVMVAQVFLGIFLLCRAALA